MKKYMTFLLLVSVGIVFGQKQIPEINIKICEDNFKISGTALTPNNIKIKITQATKENDTTATMIKGETSVSPFIKENLIVGLNKLVKDYKGSCKGKELSYLLPDSSPSKNSITPRDKEAYDFIYQYFESSITTLFKYDNEPDAGILYFNTQGITVTKGVDQYGLNLEDKYKIMARRKMKQIRNYEGERDDWPKRIKISKAEEKSEIYYNTKDVDTANLRLFHKRLYNHRYRDAIANGKKDTFDLTPWMNRRKFKKYYIDKLQVEDIIYSIQNSKFKTIIDHYQDERESLNYHRNEVRKLEKKVQTSMLDHINIFIGYSDSFWYLPNNLNPREALRKGKENLEAIIEGEANEAILKKKIDSLYAYNASKRESIYLENSGDLNYWSKINEIKGSLLKLVNDKRESIEEKNDSLNTSVSKEIEKLKRTIETKQVRLNELTYKIHKSIQSFSQFSFEIENIELDVNDGFLENITVVGKINGISLPEYIGYDLRKQIQEVLGEIYSSEKDSLDGKRTDFILTKDLKFVNEFPIGLSSKTDYADFDNYYLYHFNGQKKTYVMSLRDVLKMYVQKHQNDRTNFSPRDLVATINKGDPEYNDGYIVLKKEKTSELLKLNIFSDFIGFDEKEPNSLIQFEVNKNIPIFTRRHGKWLSKVGRSMNTGVANYLDLSLVWSRIGDADKRMPISYRDAFSNGTYTPSKYTTHLELLRYENLSVGADLNIFTVDMPGLKSRVEINGGFRYGRTLAVDSLRTFSNNEITKTGLSTETQTSTWRFYPDFIYRVRPEERYGGFFRFRPIRFNTVTEDFADISSEESFLKTGQDNFSWLHQLELQVFFKSSKTNQFFFRYRYTNTSNWETNGFHEVQIGYTKSLRF
ncbi:hypothetical protein ACFQ1M_11115 [Sungkyunkwania multivorans]|uniref:Uncharacterized protein n=1 Tax=Sungkyunkwania multivorans TaxID=1173618 RepID=A0ABW3D104_9FLAO